ncbi:metallophosphoesterase family protein [Paenibacillus sp. GCM10027626]|uniref:metallophosphoesterase family protein n=1 Tax=Paenibacillus sp. GCM10027626 TaxID=3273411 RepID=UPI00363E1FC5
MNFEHIFPYHNDKQTLIRVEGLQDAVTLMHITDSHMNETDIRDGAAALTESVRLYNYDAMDTRLKFEATLTYTCEINADAVVFTGDMVNGATVNNLALLERKFHALPMPWLYTLGNHDWEYPGCEWGEATRREQYPKFKPLTGGNPACEAKEVKGVLLITVDNSTYQISEEQLAFVKQELSRGLPALMFMHIPIYIPSLLPSVMRDWQSPIMLAAEGWDKEQQQRWMVESATETTKAFYRLMWDNPYGNLLGSFCGHVHNAHHDRFGDKSYQYVTQAGFAGGYRVIRLVPGH